MAKVEPLNRRRRLVLGIAMTASATLLGTGVILFAMLTPHAREPRAHPGLFFVAAVSLVALNRVTEAGVSEQVSRLLGMAFPLGVLLVGVSLVLSFLSPGASTMGWLAGMTYAIGGGIIAVAALAFGVAFIRSARV